MKGSECVKSYPIIEKHDAIFIWFGIDANEPPAELEFPEQLASTEWSSFLCQADGKVNHQYAIDNVMDPMHGTYLHCTSHSMAEGERTAEMKHRS
ncbi:3-phenylpropionate dioxygenase, partial [Acinetobacter gyllenbergii]